MEQCEEDQPMPQDTPELSAPEVLHHTVNTLHEHLPLHADGYKCTTEDLFNLLVGVAANKGTLESVCADLVGAPDPQTIRGCSRRVFLPASSCSTTHLAAPQGSNAGFWLCCRAVAPSVETETGGSWIPGLAVLARNDGRVVFTIPVLRLRSGQASAGIQGVGMSWAFFFCAAQLKDLSGKGILRPVASE